MWTDRLFRSPWVRYVAPSLEQGWDIYRAEDGSYRNLTTDAAWGGWLGCLGHLVFLSHNKHQENAHHVD